MSNTPTALELATTEELVEELTRRCDVLAIGMIQPTPESGSSGAFDVLFEFKEERPYQLSGFMMRMHDESELWHNACLNGTDSFSGD